MLTATQVYALGRKYTDESILGISGALAGKNCTIDSATKSDGLTTIVFKWTADDGTEKTTTIEIEDGTPIYVWSSGTAYEYGDIVIYSSAWYRCITANSDITFDSTKWNEIGSADGNYDIVETADDLPTRYTSADRKMYYCIDEQGFYLWNGTEWEFQKKIIQCEEMPDPSSDYLEWIVQYSGVTDDDYTKGYFYRCLYDSTEEDYIWTAIDTMEIAELTETQIDTLLSLLN